MKRMIINSLIVKLSVMVILIESVVLASIGVYYHRRFEAEIDKRLETQIRIPGILMNRQLLRYQSIADRGMMTELVGAELVDGMVIGADRQIFYALDADDEGKSIHGIAGFDPRWLEPMLSAPMTFELASPNETFLVNVTPLIAYQGAEPFFFVYLKVNTSRSEAQKAAIFRLFLLGSIFCILLSSAAMIASLRTFITSPLSHLEESARQIAQGNLRQTIEVYRQDELGRLAYNFLQMRDAIRQKIVELQELNQTLERKVEIRTRELKENMLLLQQEIVERKQAEEALRKAEQELRMIFDTAPALIWQKDQEGRYVQVNKAYCTTVGFSEKEILGKTDYALFPQELADQYVSDDQKILHSGKSALGVEEQHQKASGERGWSRTDKLIYCDTDGNIAGTIGFALDITDRKKAEEQIKASLKEKEVLLREIHHRVKNNLMVVTSLIEMQAGQTTHPEALALFRDLYNRVMAMAMVHKDLYQSENLAQIAFGCYVEQLMINLQQGFAKTRTAIKVVAEEIFLDVDQAIPCGLIVAELATNAFKYAFPAPPSSRLRSMTGTPHVERSRDAISDENLTALPKGRELLPLLRRGPGGGSETGGEGAEIRVEMRKKDNSYTLIVSDNGAGLPPDLDWRQTKTLGLTLVRSWAVHQLKGTLEVDNQPGATFRIVFTASHT